MSYVVFALKWRPNDFDEIIGQNNITATLKNAIQKNRLAHAYLFAGPRGVGKTSTARILAKALNCKNGPTIKPCGTCPACAEITKGNSLDVIEIDGASNRGIDEIRALRENVKFSPVQGKYKVYIIDEVHQITSEGFNALLKTLEEPPPFVKFIFATTHPHKVIPTILSRCQRLDFRRITVMEIISQLKKIAATEKIDINEKVLFAIAKSSDGSLRDAESILDQLISFSKDKVSLADVVSMLGLVRQEALFDITDKIIGKDARGVLELMNEIIDEGKDMGNFLISLIEHFRNLMIAGLTSGDPRLIDLPEDIREKLLEQARSFSLEEIFNAFNILINTQEMAKRLESSRIPLEISLVRLTQDKKGARVNPLPPKHPPAPKPPAHLEKELPKQAQAEKEEDDNESQPPGPPAENQPIPLESVKKIWANIIDNLGKIKMSAATYLNEGTPTKIEKNTLIVSFPMNHSLHKESLERKENKAIIEKVLSELLNAGIRVNFILSKEVTQKNGHDADPFLKSALETFNGRVIKEE
ncbi:MAG: DNA polymerase III subunit gamma/tau [Candidatus Omnitrophica bacterium]|nr:DNA polymerase III subunit gamma/tau [Candidatus Omnitrophota bacterium]